MSSKKVHPLKKKNKHIKKYISGNKAGKSEGEGGEGEGGAGGLKIDWRELVFGGVELPMGPNEYHSTESKHPQVMPVTTAVGAIHAAQGKNTFEAGIANKNIQSGNPAALKMQQIAEIKEQMDGPQANASPLN